MSRDTVITHAEALRLIDEQIGERVYVGFLVPRANPEDPEGPLPFIHTIGSLENWLAPRAPRLEPDAGYYQLGQQNLCFAPMAGTIHLRDNGVDFRVGDTVSIRIAWRGSKEVDKPQPNLELLTKGHRAQAEVLEASPTERKTSAGQEERRIWNLRLRVHPDDEPAFEASVEHGFRLSPDFEEKIECGLSVHMPESAEELEVVYDPDDHEQMIVFPRDGESETGAGDPKRIRLRGIVGRPLEQSPDGDA